MIKPSSRCRVTSTTLVETLEPRLLLSTVYDYRAISQDALSGYTLGEILDYSERGTVLMAADRAGAASFALWPNAGMDATHSLRPLDPFGTVAAGAVLDSEDRVLSTGQFRVTDTFFTSATMGGLAIWERSRWSSGTVQHPATPSRVVVTDASPPTATIRKYGRSGSAGTFRWTIEWTDYSRIARDSLGHDDLKLVLNADTAQEQAFSVSLVSVHDHVMPSRDASKLTAVYQATVPLDAATGRPIGGSFQLLPQAGKVRDIAGNSPQGAVWTGMLSGVSTAWTAPSITKVTDPADLPDVKAVMAGGASYLDGPITDGNEFAGFGAWSTNDPVTREPAIIVADAVQPRSVTLSGLQAFRLLAPTGLFQVRVRPATVVLPGGVLLAKFQTDHAPVWRKFSASDWEPSVARLTLEDGAPLVSEQHQWGEVESRTADGRIVNFHAGDLGVAGDFTYSMLDTTTQTVQKFQFELHSLASGGVPGFMGDLSSVGPDGEYGAVREELEPNVDRRGVGVSRVNIGTQALGGYVSNGFPDWVAEHGQVLRYNGFDILGAPVESASGPRIGPRQPGLQDNAAPWRVAFRVRTTDQAEWVVVAVPIGQRPILFLPGIFGCFPTGDNFGKFVTTFGMDPESFEMDPLTQAYDDLLATLDAHGYEPKVDLFPVGYDWRLPIAPPQEIAGGDPGNLGFARQLDGVISNMSANDITDGVYNLGTDYLGYYLVEAARKFKDRTKRDLDSVDVIAHSTGGLLTRSYIQSAAYGEYSDHAGLHLPRVNTFTQIAVPNRGASKAWNITRNNWISDIAYQVLLSALADKAYDAVMEDGVVLEIPGPESTPGSEDITAERVRALAGHSPRYTGDHMSHIEEMRLQAAFLDLYCPTVRTLSPTYEFLDLVTGGDGSAPSFTTINDDPYLRNGILLDLNDGLDADYKVAAPGRNPSKVAELANVRAIAGRLLLSDGSAESTLTYASLRVGPQRIGYWPGDHERYSHDIFQMSSTKARIPQAYEVWYAEDADEGDGTVPFRSANGPFSFKKFTVEGDASDSLRKTDHVGLNHNVDVMSLAMRLLGKPVDAEALSTGEATFITWEGIKNILRTWFGSVQAVLVDGEGRRLGWTAQTGPLTEIPGSRYLGAADGIGLITEPVTGPLRLVVTGLGGDHLVQVTGIAGGREIEPVVSSGFLAAGAQVTQTVVLGTADEFIGLFNDSAETTGDRQGFVRGDWITDWLTDHLDGVAYGSGYWGGENYWFQDSRGDVWSLWHGGPVHADPAPEFAGQHDWLLTNLTDAAGLSGQLDLLPGSISGIATGWNAFNIQGVASGKLWALWWSPGGSAGEYIDTDGTARQGLALGLRGNGWVLSSISDSLLPATPGGDLPGQLRGFTDSQGNGRTTFDPRPTRAITNDGMSIIVVDTDDQVYAISFSVSQRLIVGARPELSGVWVAEPIRMVPSIGDFGLGLLMPAIEANFIAAARL